MFKQGDLVRFRPETSLAGEYKVVHHVEPHGADVRLWGGAYGSTEQEARLNYAADWCGGWCYGTEVELVASAQEVPETRELEVWCLGVLNGTADGGIMGSSRWTA